MIWRVKGDWDHSPKGQVLLRELTAGNPLAYHALIRFILDIDLTRSVRYGLAATDEPLLHMVNEPRRLNAKLFDGLWVRVTDVPAALAARRYLTPVDVTLGVTDPILADNAGAWHLVGDPDSARCTRSDAEPDLLLDVSALGAVYLGGASLAQLAGAGRVRETDPGRAGPRQRRLRLVLPARGSRDLLIRPASRATLPRFPGKAGGSLPGRRAACCSRDGGRVGGGVRRVTVGGWLNRFRAAVGVPAVNRMPNPARPHRASSRPRPPARPPTWRTTWPASAAYVA